MFIAVLQEKYTHKLIFKNRLPVDKFGEKIAADKEQTASCIMSGSSSVRRDDKGEILSVSYTFQTDANVPIVKGDTVVKILTSDGDLLFSDGRVDRITSLTHPKQGVVAKVVTISTTS